MTQGDTIKKVIPYGKHYIDQNDVKSVIKALTSEYITQGPLVDEFEKELAKYFGSKYAVVFNSGTSSLHAAYFAANLHKNDQIITSPLTFVATSNAALYLGAKPLFCDINPYSGNINPLEIEKNLNEDVKAIVPVHYAGNPSNLKRIYKIAKENDLIIIEDAAHAIGANYEGYPIGNCKFSDMVIFSFHPVKHFTTGEGGAVLTNNHDFYERLLRFRGHGITKQGFKYEKDGEWYYEMQSLGYNYRMTDIQAALGLSQIKKLEQFVIRRREIANIYEKNFSNNPYFRTIECNNKESSYHLFPILLDETLKQQKRIIFQKLRNKGLGVQVHYIPVYLQPYYRDLGFKPGLCPFAENFYRKEITIPLFPSLKDEEVEYVINTVDNVLKKFKENIND